MNSKEEIYDLRKNWGGGTLINRPDLWPANTEIDFGDGLFGYRATGAITIGAETEAYVLLRTGINGEIISGGGSWSQSDSNHFMAVTRTGNPGAYLRQALFYRSADSKLYWTSISWMARTNAPYDVWVLYTKT